MTGGRDAPWMRCVLPRRFPAAGHSTAAGPLPGPFLQDRIAEPQGGLMGETSLWQGF